MQHSAGPCRGEPECQVVLPVCGDVHRVLEPLARSCPTNVVAAAGVRRGFDVHVSISEGATLISWRRVEIGQASWTFVEVLCLDDARYDAGCTAERRRRGRCVAALHDREVVAAHAGAVEKRGVEPVAVHVEDDRPEHRLRRVHRRIIERSAADLCGNAGNHVHGALVRGHPVGRLVIRARSVRTPAAAVLHHRGAERRRVAVVAVDQERPLVGVTVAAKYQVDAEVLQNRERVLPHLHQLDLGVRVVGAVRVRRVMKVDDNPGLRVSREIPLDPREHRARR